MKVEIELQEVKRQKINDDELTLIIRNYVENKKNVSLEIIVNDTGHQGYITVNLEALRNALDKIAL